MPSMYYKLKNKKLLLDENVSVKNEQLRKKFGFTNSTDLVGRGITDDEIFKKIKKHNLTLITSDHSFALNILANGKEVIFEDYKGTRTYLPSQTAITVEHNCGYRKYRDEVTQFLQDSEEIILP